MMQSLLAALTNDQIVAIVIASVAVAALLVVGAILFARSGKPKKNSAEESPQESAAEESAPEETAEEVPAAAAAAEEQAEEPAEEPASGEETEPAEEPASGEETEPAEEPVSEEKAEEKAEEPVNEAPAEEKTAPVPEGKTEEKPAESVQPAAAAAAAPERPRLVNAKYDKSYTARLIQSSDRTKSWYAELKNELLSYKKVHARTSWRYENFRLGRDLAARFVVRGRTLCLFFDLDPEEYINYGAEDVSDKASYAGIPCMIRVRNDRRCRYAKELISALMQKKGAAAGDKPAAEYPLPYEDDEPLLKRGLIKPVKSRARAAQEPETAPIPEPAPEPAPAPAEKTERIAVSVKEAEEQMTDEEAKARVEWGDRVTDKSKSAVVNVDTLSEYFEDGEFVGLAEMLSRIPYLSPKTTYVKVLARGKIDKALTVEADDFSPDAVKMIVLAGGRVIHTRSIQ